MIDNQTVERELQQRELTAAASAGALPPVTASAANTDELKKIQKTLHKQQKEMEKMKQQHQRELRDKERQLQQVFTSPGLSYQNKNVNCIKLQIASMCLMNFKFTARYIRTYVHDIHTYSYGCKIVGKRPVHKFNLYYCSSLFVLIAYDMFYIT